MKRFTLVLRFLRCQGLADVAATSLWRRVSSVMSIWSTAKSPGLKLFILRPRSMPCSLLRGAHEHAVVKPSHSFEYVRNMLLRAQPYGRTFHHTIIPVSFVYREGALFVLAKYTWMAFAHFKTYLNHTLRRLEYLYNRKLVEIIADAPHNNIILNELQSLPVDGIDKSRVIVFQSRTTMQIAPIFTSPFGVLHLPLLARTRGTTRTEYPTNEGGQYYHCKTIKASASRLSSNMRGLFPCSICVAVFPCPIQFLGTLSDHGRDYRRIHEEFSDILPRSVSYTCSH